MKYTYQMCLYAASTLPLVWFTRSFDKNDQFDLEL